MGLVNRDLFRRPAGGGGWTVVETKSAVSSANIDFDLATHDIFKIMWAQVVPSVNDKRIEVFLSADGGTTFRASGYSVISRAYFTTTEDETSLLSQSRWSLPGITGVPYSINVDAGFGSVGEMTLFNALDDTFRTRFLVHGCHHGTTNASGAPTYYTGGGAHRDGEVHNLIRFGLNASTNIKTGDFTLLGLTI